MAGKYKQTEVSGETWVRASRIVIDNPLDQPKTISFVEDTCIQVPGKVMSEYNGVLQLQVDESNMQDAFPLINPFTGALAGTTITYGEVYAIIYSLYLNKAEERDQAMQAEAERLEAERLAAEAAALAEAERLEAERLAAEAASADTTDTTTDTATDTADTQV